MHGHRNGSFRCFLNSQLNCCTLVLSKVNFCTTCINLHAKLSILQQGTSSLATEDGCQPSVRILSLCFMLMFSVPLHILQYHCYLLMLTSWISYSDCIVVMLHVYLSTCLFFFKEMVMSGHWWLTEVSGCVGSDVRLVRMPLLEWRVG